MDTAPEIIVPLEGEKGIKISSPALAEQANGSALVRLGDTMLLATAVMARNPSSTLGFFPLSVEYQERFYAAGKILGSRFVRREGRPSDEAVITSRLIDRAIRPLFPKRFKREVQVIATCLSWDGSNDPDVLGLLGASISLSLSNIPWKGPLGVVRVGRVEGSLVVNPTYEERLKSDLDLILAGTEEDGNLLVNMIESESNEVPESVFEEAFDKAAPHMLRMIQVQKDLRQERGLPKISHEEGGNEDARAFVSSFLGTRIAEALFQGEKLARMESVENLEAELVEHAEQDDAWKERISDVRDAFEEEVDRTVHEAAVREGRRVDDRKIDQIRDLRGEADVLPRTHGSGFFQRGQTSTLSILTLGGPGDHKLVEGMEVSGKKRFLHHYNFPPYSVGDVKPMRGPGRREIGHGMLAEKALLPVIPPFEEFPYTIRIVSEVLSSNGSSSMASACSSSLALMDAGVPIKSPVAGISLGLMSGEGGSYALLTDIQGPEDHYGDMDFKVAGTREGITAIQLDVKIKGITRKIYKEALERARSARFAILEGAIEQALAAPRTELSPHAPKVLRLAISPDKIGMVIGSGGKTINRIIQETGADIDISDEGEIFITAPDIAQAQKAYDTIQNIVREPEVGEIYQGTVKRIMDFGAFVEVLPGQEGLVHISQLAPYRVNSVRDIVKLGDVIPVKVIEIDGQGRVNLSLKDAQDGQKQAS